MEFGAIIGFIGILMGVAMFIFMALKRQPLYLAAITASITVAIFNAMNPYTALADSFMGGMSGLIKNFFLMFLGGGVFGKAMDDTGCAKKLALSLASATKRSKNQNFWMIMILPTFYFLLTYVGVSGFIIAFTMLQVARDLFIECNIPWRYFTYGSSGIVVGMIMGGNINVTNVMASEAYGVPLTAGMGISVVFVVTYFIVLAMFAMFDSKRALRGGEGFEPSGSAMLTASPAAGSDGENQLPNLFCAIAPMFCPVLIIVVFKLPAALTLFIATAVCLVLNRKQVKDLRKTLIDGLGSGIMPVINVSAANGFATVIRSSAGFTGIATALSGLPGVLPVAILGMGMTAAVGSSSSWFNAFLPTLMEWMAPLGYSAELSARFLTFTCITTMVPHNPGPVNAISMAKLEVGPAVKNYLRVSFFPGIAALIVCIALMYAGIFT